MSDELQAQLSEYLERGGAFVEEQAPLVAQEMLAWGFWVHLLGLVTGVVLLVGGPLLIWQLIAQGDKRGWDGEPVAAGSAVCSCASVVGLLMACHHSYMLLQVCVAPKVYLIEQLMGG